MDWKTVSQLPLPTLLVLLGVILVVISAAGGAHYGSAALSTLDLGGRIGLGIVGLTLCGGGSYLGLRALKSDKDSLIVNFKEILGDGAEDEMYEFKDLTTVDALLDDIYRRRLQGIVSGGSYGLEWILARKSGEKLYEMGSRWAEQHGIPSRLGRSAPTDERLVSSLAWFRPGATLRVQRREERPKPDEVGGQVRENAKRQIQIATIAMQISYEPNQSPPLKFPLKIHVEMRNDSSECIGVRLSRYSNSALLKQFRPAVLQVNFGGKWDPEHEHVAVLPGQLFRVWLGFDESKVSNTTLEQLRSLGNLGTFDLLVDGQTVGIPL